MTIIVRCFLIPTSSLYKECLQCFWLCSLALKRKKCLFAISAAQTWSNYIISMILIFFYISYRLYRKRYQKTILKYTLFFSKTISTIPLFLSNDNKNLTKTLQYLILQSKRFVFVSYLLFIYVCQECCKIFFNICKILINYPLHIFDQKCM